MGFTPLAKSEEVKTSGFTPLDTPVETSGFTPLPGFEPVVEAVPEPGINPMLRGQTEGATISEPYYDLPVDTPANTPGAQYSPEPNIPLPGRLGGIDNPPQPAPTGSIQYSDKYLAQQPLMSPVPRTPEERQELAYPGGEGKPSLLATLAKSGVRGAIKMYGVIPYMLGRAALLNDNIQPDFVKKGLQALGLPSNEEFAQKMFAINEDVDKDAEAF